MFIPSGNTVQENLATSYVQLEALVADLCEGGFSGVVEVVLRGTDSFVVLNSGNMAAVVERSTEHAEGSGNVTYTCTNIEQLAERSRLERGRLSVYAYPAATASAVAGRINARQIYVGLTSEFTDLEKMILKLVRERDREWFIEIKAGDEPMALVHMRDGGYHILNSTEVVPDGETEALDPSGSAALAKLISECNRAKATFDVYLSNPAKAGAAVAQSASSSFAEAPTVSSDEERTPVSSDEEWALVSPDEERTLVSSNGEQTPVSSDEEQTFVSSDEERTPVFSDEERTLVSSDEEQTPVSSDEERTPVFSDGERTRVFSDDINATRQSAPQADDLAAGEPELNERAEQADEAGPAALDDPNPTLSAGLSLEQAGASSVGLAESAIEEGSLDTSADQLTASPEAEAMNEIKRLMGEIARVIEEAAQAVGRPDKFSMSLRAGQLQIVDRYPFLDPFANEIEYLGGEIVFIGEASAEEFIDGLTEALKLAVESVRGSTVYGDRFRAYVTEDLRKLLAREQAAFETLGLDRVIEQIVAF